MEVHRMMTDREAMIFNQYMDVLCKDCAKKENAKEKEVE